MIGAIEIQGALIGRLSSRQSLTGRLSNGAARIAGIMTIPQTIGAEYYDGPYEITPSSEAQTLTTEELMMRDNVTIGAIPQNYGLITWDGTRIHVT